MLGFSAFAETAFGATVAHQGVVVIVTGSGVTVSMGTVTFTMSGSVIPTGSGLTISTGASEINVITWNAIDPDASQTWTNIDPL